TYAYATKETKARCKILQSREDFLCRVADVLYCRVNNSPGSLQASEESGQGNNQSVCTIKIKKGAP
ncbi:MAG: hypothetical protein ABW068_14190, partial [Candidatus Thiodiazotropha sp.]